MSIALVTGQTAVNQSTSLASPFRLTATLPAGATAGSLLVLWVSYFQSSPAGTPVTDDKGNTWAQAGVWKSTTGGGFDAIYYATNVIAATRVVTWTHTASAHVTLALAEFSGAATSTPLDTAVGNTATSGTSMAPGSITPAGAGELFIFSGTTDSGASTTTPTGYTNVSNQTGSTFQPLEADYFINTGTTASAPTSTIGGSTKWAVNLAAFKPSTGGGSFTGTAAAGLQKLAGAASGMISITGTASASLKHLGAAAAGTRTVPAFTGTGTPALKHLTGAASGTSTVPSFTGTGAASLKHLTAAASGTESVPAFTGTAAASFKHPGSAASGTSTVPAFTGTGAASLQHLTAAATGTRTIPAITGTVSASLQHLTSAASGTATGAGVVTGTVAASLQRLTGAASGTRTIPDITGTAAVSLKHLTGAATGVFGSSVTTGLVAASLKPFAASGAGTRTLPAITGSGAASFRRLAGHASGSVATIPGAAGALQIGALTIHPTLQFASLSCVAALQASVGVEPAITFESLAVEL